MQLYDYNIRFKPGKEMVIADTLSRAYGSSEQQHGTQIYSTSLIQSPFERSLEIVTAIEDVQLTETQLEELRKATAEDKVIPDVIRAVRQGWPSERKDVPPDLRPYFHHRDELVESCSVAPDALYP